MKKLCICCTEMRNKENDFKSESDEVCISCKEELSSVRGVLDELEPLGESDDEKEKS